MSIPNSIIDSDGNPLNSIELALIFNKNRKYINEVIRKHNSNTLKELVGVFAGKARNTRVTVYIPDKDDNVHTLKEVADILGKSRSWATAAYRRGACSTFEDFEYLKEHPIVINSTNRFPANVKFDRGAFCYRNNFSETCEHYVSCSDSRCFKGKHHERYRPDGSCYTKESKKWERPSFKENRISQFFS